MNILIQGTTWKLDAPTALELNFEKMDSLTALLMEYRRAFKAAEEQLHAANSDEATDAAAEAMAVQVANVGRMFHAIARRVERWVRTTALASAVPQGDGKDEWLIDVYQQVREQALPAETVKN